MHKVTDEQVDFILEDIAKKGIVTEDVRYNILDHVCCILENEMPDGTNFVEFYKNTIARFYRKELQEIEEETKQLITFKYYHAMKRTAKITGLVSVLLILIGSVMKLQHLLGANILFVLGFAIFSLVFIPLNIIMKLRDDKEKYNRIVMTLGFTLTLTGTIGLLFKLMHWPYANILFIGSVAIFGLVFIPIYFFINYRRPETKFNAIINSTFMIAAAGMLFALITVKPSENMQEAKDADVNFQLNNIATYDKLNTQLYSEVESRSAKSVESFKKVTSDILECIRGIEMKLISKSNKIEFMEAAGLSIKDIDKPNDHTVVHQYFSSSKDEFSHQNLMTELEVYNDNVTKLDEAKVARKIDVSKLNLEDTILEMLLSSLVDIKIQVLSNENAYLSYQKGLMASK